MIRHIKNGQSAETKAENSAQVRKTVEAILADISARGEAAVREYSEKFDKWRYCRVPARVAGAGN
jgi:sulfopropanediol 3-dehydrogenase